MSSGLDLPSQNDKASPLPGKRTRELQQSEAGLRKSSSPSPSSTAASTSQSVPPSLHVPPASQFVSIIAASPDASSPRASSPSHDQYLFSGSNSATTSPRRARAGTMPSTFQLSSGSISGSSKAVGSTPAMLSVPSNPAGGSSISLPASGHSTPLSSEFAFSSPLISTGLAPSATNDKLAIPTSEVAAANSRLRSGSLTLPNSGLSNAFGPNVFSTSTWAPQPVDTNTAGVLPTGSSGLRSPESSTYGGDGDSHVRTLDYLGLDSDSPQSGFGLFSEQNSPLPASPLRAGTNMQRMGSLGAAGGSATGQTTEPKSSSHDFANAHTRLRSNTVAAFPRSNHYGMVGNPNTVGSRNALVGEEDVFGSAAATSAAGAHRSNTSVDSGGRLIYSSSTQEEDERADTVGTSTADSGVPSSSTTMPLSPGRARAVTIGILDESREVFMRRRAGTTTGLTPHVVSMGMGQDRHAADYDDYGQDVAASGIDHMTRAVRGLSIGQHDEARYNGSRPRTPDGATSLLSLTPSNQQPTRSLWIGNLDPRTTPAELQTVFAPYGAIESLRLIPEKECGFVNFMTIGDAIRAKEDILNRLGGQLANSSNLVRIGFGKDVSLSGNSSAMTQMRTISGPILVPVNPEDNPYRQNYSLYHQQQLQQGGGGPGRLPLGGFMGPEELNPQTAPTRALWIGSIPSTTTSNQLLNIFAAFGPIESARILTHKSCGFINFERLDDAIAARKALNGREILGAEVGGVRIGFAKVPTKIVNGPPNGVGSLHSVYDTLSHMAGADGVPLDQQLADPSLADYRSNLVLGAISNSQLNGARRVSDHSPKLGFDAHDDSSSNEHANVETSRAASINDLQVLVRELSGEGPETEADIQALANVRTPPSYYASIPLQVLNDPLLGKRYSNSDTQRLRDMRKQLDSPQLSTDDVDGIAFDLLEECVAFSSDYIGNTVVQKLFERGSLSARIALLERISPHLAAIGTHKNGTWAVQKIIQCVQEPQEMAMIEHNLAPYTPPLLLNDFGNYVVQGALRFGSPHSDFIFDAIVDRCWEIGSGRFGARSTRQTLENPQTTRLNIKRVAAALVLNSIPLATSANGTLLITWLLDTSNLPGRYRVLALRFAPHLPHLCTHKLASSAVIKVINQRIDVEASKILLEALIDPNPKTLEEILADQVHGPACVSKIINASSIDPTLREKLMERVRTVLTSLRVSSIPAYRKLQEDLGMVAPASLAPNGLNSMHSQSGSSHSFAGNSMQGARQISSSQQRYDGASTISQQYASRPMQMTYNPNSASPQYGYYPMNSYGQSPPPSTSPYQQGSLPSHAITMNQPQVGYSQRTVSYPNYYTSAPSYNVYPPTSASLPMSNFGSQGLANNTMLPPLATPPMLSPSHHDINFHPFSPTGSMFGKSESGSHAETQGV